jgi:hypothetical protein
MVVTPIYLNKKCKFTITLLGMSIDMNDIGGGHIDIEWFYRFRNLLYSSLKDHISLLFVLQIVVHKCKYFAAWSSITN